MKALITFITTEWYFFLPMLVLSLVAAALVVWRLLLNLNARTNLEAFLPVFQEKLQIEGVEGGSQILPFGDGRHPAEALCRRAGELPARARRHEKSDGQCH